jgi:hypothetical protein
MSEGKHLREGQTMSESKYQIQVTVLTRGYNEMIPIGEATIDLVQLLHYVTVDDFDYIYRRAAEFDFDASRNPYMTSSGEDIAAARIYNIARKHGLCKDFCPEVEHLYGEYQAWPKPDQIKDTIDAMADDGIFETAVLGDRL